MAKFIPASRMLMLAATCFTIVVAHVCEGIVFEGIVFEGIVCDAFESMPRRQGAGAGHPSETAAEAACRGSHDAGPHQHRHVHL